MPRRTKNPRQLRLAHTARRSPRSKRGRPRIRGRDSRVAHRERPRFVRRAVIGITLRVVDGLPWLRARPYAVALRKALQRGCFKDGFSICQFSIQGNHLHMACEADNHVALARGMQGFAARAAKAINKVARRKGRVWNDRYHVRYVRGARQIRNLLRYVLLNHRRHDRSAEGVDPFSSARHFDGWARRPDMPPPPTDSTSPPVAPAETHELKTGWKFSGLGLISPDETPAGVAP